MSLNKRYIDINFDVDARPLRRVPGTIVQGNNKVNILRITYPNIKKDHVVVALSQRADQETGSTFLNYSSESNSFELILHNWFTVVSGELQITFAVYNQTPEIDSETGVITTETDTLRKVYLNVEESVCADLPVPEDESIFIDVAVMVRTFENRLNELINRVSDLEGIEIADLSELDNYTIPGVYKFILEGKSFNLFVNSSNGTTTQIRSSNEGYYKRILGETNTFKTWQYFSYDVNGITIYNDNINYSKGAIVNYNGFNYESLVNDNYGILPDDTFSVTWRKLDFDTYTKTESDNRYVQNSNDLENIQITPVQSFGVNIGQSDGTGGLYFSAYSFATYFYDVNSNFSSFTTTSQNIDLSSKRIVLNSNDILLNNKSWNEIYNKVQSLYSANSFIESEKFLNTILVPTQVSNYASLKKIGGETYLIQSDSPYFLESKVTELKIKSPNLLRGLYNTGADTTLYTKTVDEEGWITLDFHTMPESSKSVVIYRGNNLVEVGETYTARLIFRDNKVINMGSVVITTQAADANRFTTLGYDTTKNVYKSYTGVANYAIDNIYIWVTADKAINIKNVQFKVELVKGDGTPVQTISIPDTIKNLDGYGLSVPNTNVRNIVDLENNNFPKKCSKYTFTGNEELVEQRTLREQKRYWFAIKGIKSTAGPSEVPNIALNGLSTLTPNEIYLENTGVSVETSNGNLSIFHQDYQTITSMLGFLKGKTLIYELDSPEVVNIDSTFNNFIKVEEGQEIEFVNENNRAIYSVVEYMEDN